MHERAMMEMGKTPLGNTCFTKNKKLGMDAAAAEKGELKGNKVFFILSLDGGGLRCVLLTPTEGHVAPTQLIRPLVRASLQGNRPHHSVGAVGRNLPRPDGACGPLRRRVGWQYCGVGAGHREVCSPCRDGASSWLTPLLL